MDNEYTVIYKAVKSVEDAEVLRVIRNTCNQFMTRHSAEITPEEQQVWFKTAHEKYDIFLMWAMHHGVCADVMGYGLVHKNEDCYLVTGGLLPHYRDKGHGVELFKFLIDSCPDDKPIRLEVLSDNIRAIKTYTKLGFVTVTHNDKIINMEYKNDSAI